MALRAAYSLPSSRPWLRARPFVLGLLFLCISAIAYRVLVYEKIFQGIDESQRPKMAPAVEFLKRNRPHLGRLRMYCFQVPEAL